MKAKESPVQAFDYQDSDKDLFKDVVFLVECTHYEQMSLWQDWYDKPKYDSENARVKSWREDTMGHTITVGRIGDRPVCITIFWAWLEGYKVMFYEATSQVVDHKMIEDWIKHFSKDIKHDNGYRWSHTNAMNFSHCVHAIHDMVKFPSKARDAGVQKAAERIASCK